VIRNFYMWSETFTTFLNLSV